MTPRIGLTSSRPRERDRMPSASVVPYVRAIERAGGRAVLLENDAARVDETLARIDGVVLGGGVDVDPRRYGGNADHAHSQRDSYRPRRDDFEIALVRALRERGVPMLGICRGLQVANVAFGGTLVEDIGAEFGKGSTIDHRQTSAAGVERIDYAAGHSVRVAADSALARLVGSVQFETNSIHHQAVRGLGDGLAAVAHTSDGIVEAVDATFAHPFFFAVQWHPEELDDKISLALFNNLVRVARNRS